MTNTAKFIIAALLIGWAVYGYISHQKIITLRAQNKILSSTVENQYYAIERYGHYTEAEE